jgi:hypothetical protein
MNGEAEVTACDECKRCMLRSEENEERGKFSDVLLQGCKKSRVTTFCTVGFLWFSVWNWRLEF